MKLLYLATTYFFIGVLFIGCSSQVVSETDFDSSEFIEDSAPSEEADASISEVNEVVVETDVPAYIDVPNLESISVSENGAYYVYGTTSNNCSSVNVLAQNLEAGVSDDYNLAEYHYGDSSFRYGIRSDFNNLGIGENSYLFTAYCDGGQEVSDFLVLTYSVSTYTEPSPSGSTYSDTTSYDYSTTYPSYTYVNSVDDLNRYEADIISICNEEWVYLGNVSGRYDDHSIFNKYGDYGSKYSDLSMWDQYGDYGSKYSDCGAFNSYAGEPPGIYIDGDLIGYVSQNKYAGGLVVDPNELLLFAYQEFGDDHWLDLMRD